MKKTFRLKLCILYIITLCKSMSRIFNLLLFLNQIDTFVWLKAHKDLLLKTFFNLITTQNKPHSGNTAFVQSVEQIVYIQSPQQNLSNNNNKKQSGVMRVFQASSSYFSCTHNSLQVLPHKTIWRLKPMQCDTLVLGRESKRDIACGGTSFCSPYKTHNACHFMYIS